MQLTSLDRSIHGTWTAGRLVVTPEGSPTETAESWTLDVVLDEQDRLRAVARARPSRGTRPSLARVVDEAITHPLIGRPHLPARLRVASHELARELRELPAPVTTEVGATPAVARVLASVAREFIPPEASWRWLSDGADRAAIESLHEGMYLLTTTFAWYTLSGQEATRATFSARGETVHLRLEARDRFDGSLRLSLHVAPDEDTLAAWREGLIGERELVITEHDKNELSREAFAERKALGMAEHDLFARVTVGPARRAPNPEELRLAARSLAAFNALHDSCQGGDEGVQERELEDGEVVELEELEDEFVLFPENDGGPEVVDACRETWEDRQFLDSYFAGAFDRPQLSSRGMLA